MADPKQFTLIGDFVDKGIVSSFDKINKSLDSVKKNLESLSKITSPLKNDFKDLAAHSKDFQSSLKGQAGELTAATRALRDYRTEMARLRNTQRKLKFPPVPPIGGGPGGSGPGGSGGGRGGGGGGNRGGGGGGPRPPRGGGYGGYTARDSTYVFGQVLGNQIAGVMTGAIVQGFQMGVGLMMKPFEYLAGALKERIADEQSDIKAAGGYYSISRRQKEPFVKSFAEAMAYTQENNKYMAQLAAALPGNTQQYIEVMKRISDSISRTVMSDPKKAIEFANKLREDPERIGGAVAPITGTTPESIRKAITEVGGEITKKTVLAGLGGGAGPGGVAGAYGLPGLTERLLTQQDVSMGQFRRYAAIFRDPLISEALERYIPKIRATQAGTIERLKVLNEMYDEVLPPEMVRAFQRSTEGIIEMYNTALFGPETGFFGLGRKMSGLGKKMDAYGRYIDEMGRVTTDFNKAAPEALSIFDMLRDIFANFGIVLSPLVESLPLLFDPLKNIGATLTDLRHFSGRLLNSFEVYKNGLVDLSKGLGEQDKIRFLSTLNFRATFATLNNAFKQFGVYGKETFSSFANQIESLDFNPGKMLKTFIKTFLSSNLSYKLGYQIGYTVRVVLEQISTIINELVGVATASNLVSGLKEGFGKEGRAAFSNIIQKVFQLIGTALLEVVKAAPGEIAILGAITLGLPAFVAGLSTVIGNKVERFLDVGLKKVLDKLLAGGAKIKNMRVGMFGAGFDWINKFISAVSTLGNPSRWAGALRTFMSGFGGRFTGFFKGFLGKLSIFGGIITSIISIFEGASLANSLAAGAGPVLGAALGAALIPFLGPIGPIIGAWVGSLEAVQQPLAMAFDGILGSFEPLVGLFNQIFSDIAGLLGQTDKLGDGFNALQLAIFALLSPFKLLQLGIMGIYLLYLETKRRFLGLSENEKKTYNKLTADTQRETLSFQIEGMRALGKTLATIKAEELENFKNAKARGDEEAMNASVRMIRAIEDKIRGTPSNRVGVAPKPASPKAVVPVTKSAPVGNTVTSLGGIPRPPVGSQTKQQDAQLSKLNQKIDTSNSTNSAISAKSARTAANTTAINAQTKSTVKNTSTTNQILNSIKSATISISNKVSLLQSSMGSSLNNIQAGVNAISNLLKSGNLKMKSDFNFGGGSLGGGSGGPPIFGAAARQFGLTMTSGYRPGDPGYHGINRARDYSNGSSPTPQMMMFAQFMASNFGRNLKELIYTPLGYSIKDGRKVPPYAQSSHYDHVHVAYGLGAGAPAFFSSASAADRWERAMAPRDPIISSVRARANEVGSNRPVQVNAPISIYQQPGQDPEELATIVVTRLGMAIQTVSSHL